MIDVERVVTYSANIDSERDRFPQVLELDVGATDPPLKLNTFTTVSSVATLDTQYPYLDTFWVCLDTKKAIQMLDTNLDTFEKKSGYFSSNLDT